jgi:hypothetical protein
MQAHGVYVAYKEYNDSPIGSLAEHNALNLLVETARQLVAAHDEAYGKRQRR